MKNMLTQKKAELESLLQEADSKLEEEAERARVLAEEKKKLQAGLQTLEEQ